MEKVSHQERIQIMQAVKNTTPDHLKHLSQETKKTLEKVRKNEKLTSKEIAITHTLVSKLEGRFSKYDKSEKPGTTRGEKIIKGIKQLVGIRVGSKALHEKLHKTHDKMTAAGKLPPRLELEGLRKAEKDRTKVPLSPQKREEQITLLDKLEKTTSKLEKRNTERATMQKLENLYPQIGEARELLHKKDYEGLKALLKEHSDKPSYAKLHEIVEGSLEKILKNDKLSFEEKQPAQDLSLKMLSSLRVKEHPKSKDFVHHDGNQALTLIRQNKFPQLEKLLNENKDATNYKSLHSLVEESLERILRNDKLTVEQKQPAFLLSLKMSSDYAPE